jgi:hypothetical protein
VPPVLVVLVVEEMAVKAPQAQMEQAMLDLAVEVDTSQLMVVAVAQVL